MQPNGYVFLLNVALFAFCTAKATQKYRKTRAHLTLYLMALLLALTLINLASAIDMIFQGTLYAIHYGYAISLFVSSISSIAFLFLAFDVFFAENKPGLSPKLMILRNGYAVFLITICIFSGLERLNSSESSTTISLVIKFIADFLSYLLLSTKAYSLAKTIKEDVFKTSITFIGHFSVANLIMFVFFIIESFNIGKEGMTLWSFLGACMLSVMAILVYMGFLKPVNEIKKAS